MYLCCRHVDVSVSPDVLLVALDINIPARRITDNVQLSVFGAIRKSNCHVSGNDNDDCIHNVEGGVRTYTANARTEASDMSPLDEESVIAGIIRLVIMFRAGHVYVYADVARPLRC